VRRAWAFLSTLAIDLWCRAHGWGQHQPAEPLERRPGWIGYRCERCGLLSQGWTITPAYHVTQQGGTSKHEAKAAPRRVVSIGERRRA
jgi:hypothetical protein